MLKTSLLELESLKLGEEEVLSCQEEDTRFAVDEKHRTISHQCECEPLVNSQQRELVGSIEVGPMQIELLCGQV